MSALLFALLLGQCGPNGCSIPPGSPQWQPVVIDRTAWQPAVFDIEAVPPDAEVWFDSHAVRLLSFAHDAHRAIAGRSHPPPQGLPSLRTPDGHV